MLSSKDAMTTVSDIPPTLHSSQYERTSCTVGIVHIGFGAFHRAHQAVYVDEAMQVAGDLSWGICAVNLRPEDSDNFNRSAQAIESNAGYLLKTTTHDGLVRYQKVRSHIQFADWCLDAAATESLLASSDVTMVTITVTESGYVLSSRGQLDTNDALLKAEISGDKSASSKRITIYAYLARALSMRASTINKKITVCCCDNIRDNGHMLQANFMRYLELTNNKDLADWVQQNVSFPCSMVDRITPASTDELRHEVDSLSSDHSAFDKLSETAIHAESFRQWVLQDNMAAAKPPLSQAGVEITEDVKPFEEAKIRILNGGHTCLAYPGVLSGYATYDQALADRVLTDHFDRFQYDEVLVGLPDDLPFDKSAYLISVKQRFGNQAIADSLARICMDGYAKMQIFMRPTIEACFSKQKIPEYAIFSVASWFVYAKRIHNKQLKARYVEPNWHLLEPLLKDSSGRACANSEELWADLPEHYPQFEPAFLAAVKQVEERWPL